MFEKGCSSCRHFFLSYPKNFYMIRKPEGHSLVTAVKEVGGCFSFFGIRLYFLFYYLEIVSLAQHRTRPTGTSI